MVVVGGICNEIINEGAGGKIEKGGGKKEKIA